VSHFSKVSHVRGTCRHSDPSAIYFAAFLVENEIQDLFGIRFSGLAIDYQRTLYGEESTRITPFCKYTVVASTRANEQPGPKSGGTPTREEA
jgi:hypothetical protein